MSSTNTQIGKILIGIGSTRHSMDKREAIRATWLSQPSAGIQGVFFIGGETSTEELDTVATGVPEGSAHSMAKVKAFFACALGAYPFDWLFNCDDETYVVVDRLHELIQGNHDLVGALGLFAIGHADGRAGYLLSRRMVEMLASDTSLQLAGREDSHLTESVLRNSQHILESPRLSGSVARFPESDAGLVTARCVDPDAMRALHTVLWEKPVREISAFHHCWRDRLSLFLTGVFVRRSDSLAGRWHEDPAGNLHLAWKEGSTEVFCPFGDIPNGYRLERPPNSYSDTATNDGFAGDRGIGAKLQSLVNRLGISLAVETGTFRGETTRALAKFMRRVKTIEVDVEKASASRGTLADLPHVEVFHGNSAEILGSLIQEVREPVLFYLDAHWLAEWPLLAELRAIARSPVPIVLIAIHDFKVSGLGFDSYGGHDLDFEYVHRSMQEIFPFGFNWETNDARTAEGARRGIGYFYSEFHRM